MICGNCKDRDQTVEHVKACYDGRTIQAAVTKRRSTPGAQPLPVTEPGVYFDGTDYFKVVWNQSHTHLYAKVWNISAGGWNYAAGALKRLTADMRVTAEQAARFGKLWGSCVFCGKLLTDERSVTVGYGPVCAEHNGLPWGEVAPVEVPVD